ncbi:NUDIX domain-containing protein [Nocardioides agariphilus]|jgi:ADP-ribose pyrophosphatase YjhB (NUDIX family)|uniref:NUDIX domain-containing protein n=1 Tax=Nocardioides agariphilus TaxID=433664 RepID=A0A930VFI7_9ACTN|nr:NUDIX domain-containing protein [Nocardioides agariphilus]MBF4766569.1 NUDIX domain-containing protein [Nocardioides agariphilus]
MALPRRQRVAAYAVIVRDERILLCKLAPWITPTEQWTLPGGGLDHGEDPRDAVIREISEETGLDAFVGEQARVYSAHQARVRRDGRRSDYHALRIVYDAWVAPDAPQPRVVEVDGSTVATAWHPLADVLDGTIPTVPLVQQALADWAPYRMQRVGAYALVTRGDPRDGDVLLVRFSAKGFHTGSWSLPGGGIDHGERPANALVREVEEECGMTPDVGELLLVHDEHFSGTAPSGRYEDFHAVALVFAARIDADAVPKVVEVDGTTDLVEWVPRREITDGSRPVLDVVHAALQAGERRRV